MPDCCLSQQWCRSCKLCGLWRRTDWWTLVSGWWRGSMDSLSRSPIRDTLADDAPDKLYKLPKTASCHGGCYCDFLRHPLRPTSTSSMPTLRPTTCLRYVAATRCPVVLRCDQQRSHKLDVVHEFRIRYQQRLRNGKGDKKPAWPAGQLNRLDLHGVGMWDNSVPCFSEVQWRDCGASYTVQLQTAREPYTRVPVRPKFP